MKIKDTTKDRTMSTFPARLKTKGKNIPLKPLSKKNKAVVENAENPILPDRYHEKFR